jgi:hypothetical protein
MYREEFINFIIKNYSDFSVEYYDEELYHVKHFTYKDFHINFTWDYKYYFLSLSVDGFNTIKFGMVIRKLTEKSLKYKINKFVKNIKKIELVIEKLKKEEPKIIKKVNNFIEKKFPIYNDYDKKRISIKLKDSHKPRGRFTSTVNYDVTLEDPKELYYNVYIVLENSNTQVYLKFKYNNGVLTIYKLGEYYLNKNITNIIRSERLKSLF